MAPPPDETIRFSSVNLVIYVLLILSAFLVFFGGNLSPVNWGLDQTLFISATLRYILLVLCVGLIVWMILKPQEPGGSGKLFDRLFGAGINRPAIILLIGALAIFVIFRFEAHVFGNGYIRISNLAQRAVPIFRWHEWGSTAIPFLFYKTLNLFGVEQISAAIRGYQIASFFSGLLFVFISLKISGLVSELHHRRMAFLILALLSGLTLLFFGVVENAPLLLPAGALIILFILKWHISRQSKYLYYLWVAFIIGLVLNIQFLSVLPALLYVTFSTRSENKTSDKLGLYFAAAVIIAGSAVTYLWAHNNIAVANAVLLLSGKQPVVNYSLFSARHLLDLLNLLFLYMPLWPILLYAVIARRINDALYVSFLLLTVGQLIVLFILDPKNGMARDFNNYGFLLSGFLFWGAYALAADRNNRSTVADRFGRRLGLIGVILVIPTFMVHLSPQASISYLDRNLEYNETKLEPALLAFRDYYFSVGDYPEANRREQAIVGKVQNALQSQLVNDLFAQKRVDEAFSYANQLVTRDPYNAIYRMQLGNILKYFKKYDDAERELNAALTLDPYRADYYHFLSDLYRERRRPDSSYLILSQGLSINPVSSMLLTDLAGYYYQSGDYHKTDSLCTMALASDTAAFYAYMYKGFIAEKNGQLKEAMDYYTKFLNSKSFPEIPAIRKRMNNIYLLMNDSTARR